MTKVWPLRANTCDTRQTSDKLQWISFDVPGAYFTHWYMAIFDRNREAVG